VYKRQVYIWSFAQPLYKKSDHVVLNFGSRIRKEVWSIKAITPKELENLQEMMNKEITEVLIHLTNSSDFYNYYVNKCTNIRMLETVVYSALMSELDDSEQILDQYVDVLKKENLAITWVADLLSEAEELKELLLRKDNSLKKLLLEHIEFTKSKLGV